MLRYNPCTGQFTKNNTVVGCRRKDGYIAIQCGIGIQYLAHRLAWKMVYGRWPLEEIDHIDGNRGNNSIWNLRDVSRGENSMNSKFHRSGGVAKRRNRPGRRARYISHIRS